MIRLEEVSRSYGPLLAVAATTLEFEAATTTVLIGPSGCGKSTLLRIIIGLVYPDSGSVYVDGERMTPENVLRIRRKMGYVIQEGGLFPHLTAYRNVSLIARHLKYPPMHISQRMEELAELVHIPLEWLHRYPSQLSGGQRQRVSLMRALMLDPEVLLLDEPLGALDPMIRSELQMELRHIFNQLRKTVILVTHDLGEAAFFGDRLILLREGRIVQSGSYRELLSTPTEPFVTAFVNAQRSPLDSLENAESRTAPTPNSGTGVHL